MTDHILTIGTTVDTRSASGRGKPVALSLARLIRDCAFFAGARGAGKSYGIRVLAEQALPHCQTFVIDVDGEFASLREKFDLVVVGKVEDGADVAAKVSTAAQVAMTLYHAGLSAVLDLYGMKVEDQAEWIAIFCNTLMAQPRASWHRLLVILDEVHRFAGNETKKLPSYPAICEMMTAGRKHRLGVVLATTRIAKLAPNARADAATRFVGFTRETIDVERGGDSIGLPSSERHTIQELAKGTFFVVGNALISDERTLFRFNAAQTTHPDDMTETVAARSLVVPPPSPALAQAIRTLWHVKPEEPKPTPVTPVRHIVVPEGVAPIDLTRASASVWNRA